MMTLYGKEIPEPDGGIGDYALPKGISDYLDGPSFIMPPALMSCAILARSLRWKNKEDMDAAVKIFKEINGDVQ